ncbi:MAG: tyrosine-type recombinase/integrase, partial [Thermodesulfobacteriota bacterium]
PPPFYSPTLRHNIIITPGELRFGEILNLTWKGIDLFRKTITVFESKNNEKRSILMNDVIFEMHKNKSKIRSIKTDILFLNRVGTARDERNVRRMFEKAVKKADIEDFKFHDLRHTFATRLVRGGCDFYKVQKLLGHKSPLMTQRYAHHCPESLRDALDILSNSVTNRSQLIEETSEVGG